MRFQLARARATIIIAAIAVGSVVLQSRLAGAGVANTLSHVNSIGMQLRLIPAGAYRMGSPESEKGRRPNERPLETVTLDRAFLMGAHEVTVGQFRTFVESTGYQTEAERDGAGGFGIDFETGEVVRSSGISWRDPGFPGFEQTDDHPVVLVSWRDADAFCRWLSAIEGRTYRLPSEAEWEYACRAGTSGRYWSGEQSESLHGVANVADASLHRRMPLRENAAPFNDGHPFTAPVGSFRPNAFGLHDMHGNVWEWCNDVYRDAVSDEPVVVVTHEGDRDNFRSIRGGGWLNGPDRNRAAQRVYFGPSFRYCLLSGFRVVVELEHVE